ncbi:ABC transporter ATP-binding protein [Desnuesiella massiliensis]|uniref:ABC transporter ATP-binding protein n=1 Tax=Desnuesiella massiliensis TaxID=1650662 RepID=UPI0006E16DCD|nr:ABC transporter ATP-binding protein [Desnuesiella massiliensis]
MIKKFRESEFIKTLHFMKPRIGEYTIGVLIDSALTSICYNIVLAFIMRDVINAIAYKDIMLMKRAFYVAVGSFLIAFILQPIFRFLYKACVRKAMAEIRLKTFEHMEDLKVENFEKHHTGDLISRMTNDVDVIQQIYINQIPTLSFALIHGLVAMISMFIMEWRLALIAITIGLISVSISATFSKSIRKASDEVQIQYGSTTERLIDIIDGLQIIKMFDIKEKIYNKYNENDKLLNLALMKNGRLNIMLEVINNFYGDFKNIGLLSLGLYMSIKGGMDIGTIAAIIHLQGNASFLLENIGSFIAGIQGSMSGASRVIELLNRETEIEKEKTYDESRNASPLSIEMKDVYFSYDDERKVLNSINIAVKKGERAALVGTSGSGKSTIIKLLMGFYNKKKGEIYINGRSLDNMSLEKLRNYIGYVPQDSYLFHGTIEENIRYGNMNATKEDIIEAAKAAYAHDFIISLPQGYDTMVGEMGGNISGGQRQRIAIARALLKDAPILLLDEATSSLDSESEQLVQKALDRLMEGRTTIAVAHRLATIKTADRIYVLQSGEIVEEGNNEELLLKDGIYRHLYDLQFLNEVIRKK